MAKAEYKTLEILGSTIDMVDLPQIISIMERWVSEFPVHHRCRQIVVTGFHGTWESHKNTELKEIFNSADLWVPDGIAPVLVGRVKGMRNINRTPGHDILRSFLKRANEKGYRGFFYGDTEETLISLRNNLERDYPGHMIAGMFSPPFREVSPEEDDEIVRMINDSKPDVLWVGLGCPKQDQWIHAHKDRLNVPVAIGVGAVFRFQAGIVERVPEWIGRSGFEWAWRFAKEPKKLWRRNLIEAPRFVGHVLLELSGLKKY
jgi:N-acetylglucosaminyldiphosphoundecaprenol N-acetyl-beta-D-mannosaminyltransferase